MQMCPFFGLSIPCSRRRGRLKLGAASGCWDLAVSRGHTKGVVQVVHLVGCLLRSMRVFLRVRYIVDDLAKWRRGGVVVGCGAGAGKIDHQVYEPANTMPDNARLRPRKSTRLQCRCDSTHSCNSECTTSAPQRITRVTPRMGRLSVGHGEFAIWEHHTRRDPNNWAKEGHATLPAFLDPYGYQHGRDEHRHCRKMP